MLVEPLRFEEEDVDLIHEGLARREGQASSQIRRGRKNQTHYRFLWPCAWCRIFFFCDPRATP
jgi:hypothetical protein